MGVKLIGATMFRFLYSLIGAQDFPAGGRAERDFNQPLAITGLAFFLLAATTLANGQLASVPSIGLTPAQDFQHTAIDSVNLQSGNVNLHIPILSFPQVGGKLHMGFMLRYNAPVWQFVPYPTPVLNPSTGNVQYQGEWQLWNDFSQNTALGVDLVRDQGMTVVEDYLTFPCLGNDGSGAGNCMNGDPANQNGGKFGGTGSTSVSHFSVRDRTGAVHKVGVTSVGVNAANGYLLNTFISAPDGSGWKPVPPSNGIWPGSAYMDRDGLLYTVGSVPGATSGTSLGAFTTITDRNGQSITGSANGWTDSIGRQIPGSYSGPGNGIAANGIPVEADPFPGIASTAATDLSHCPSAPTPTAVRIFTVPSYASATETYYLCFSTQQLQTAFDITKLNYGLVTSTERSYTVTMMSALVLPNKTLYTFQYDPYGDLTEVTFPTGGNVTYQWETIPWDAASTSNPVTRAVASRTVNSLTQPSGTWSYAWTIGSGPLESPGAVSVSVNVSKPDGNDEYHSTDDSYSDRGAEMPNPPQYLTGQTTVSYYNGHSPHNPNGGTGTLIRNEVTTHELLFTPFIEPLPALPPNSSLFPYHTGGQYPTQPSTFEFSPLVVGPNLMSTTTYENGAVSATIYTPIPSGIASFQDPGLNIADETPQADICYCIQYGQYSSIATYDIGSAGTGKPGPLIDTQHYTYVWNSGTSAATSYLAQNLVDLTQKVVTTDGNGNWQAETDYAYDESNGSPGGARGNLTSVTKVNNAGANEVTHTVYNSLGMHVKEMDADGNATYASVFQCSGLFPQTVISPYGSSTTTAETHTYLYDCNTGNLSSYTDPNTQPVTYSYVDSMARLTGITYPDGGSVSISYNGDPTPPLITKTTTTGELTGSIKETTQYDGLGRVTETQLTTDPNGAILADTGYNALGEVISKSNPYRNSTDPTYGHTLFSYDGLGRKIRQTNADTTVEQWCYDDVAYPASGNYCSAQIGSVKTGTWIDFTDEVGNHWQRTSDALGRLKAVIEPNGSSTVSSLETDYGYDVLNNLISVVQWGGASGSASARTRSFTYDSLSRLLTANNPETGTVCYGLWSGANCATGYDPNGNLLHKTDARGVVTNYTYDALNRILSRAYSNDPSATPFACYQYDTSALTSPNPNPNWIGRLTNHWNQSASAGSCPAAGLPANGVTAGIVSRNSVLAYDALGRILFEQQCTPFNCTGGTPYAPAYTYNLAGSERSRTNGITSTPTVGTLTFTNAYDAAGRLLTLTSNWNDSTHPGTLLSAVTGTSLPCQNSLAAPYTAFGSLMNAQLGSGVVVNRGYDIRMRTTCETDTGNTVGAATSATGTILITGSEQSK